jgi:hypothetical protein
MTVAELIVKLQAVPSGVEVFVSFDLIGALPLAEVKHIMSAPARRGKGGSFVVDHAKAKPECMLVAHVPVGWGAS